MNDRKKVGLALGSGGVRGLAHIGVIKSLVRAGVPIDYLSGSSIGSWVAAHFSLYQDIEKTADFTAGKKKEKLFSFLEPSISGGLVKGDKLEILLDDWLGGASFSDLQIPLKMAATDILSGDKVVISEGRLSIAVRASMAIPGFFKPVVLGNQVLVDSGLSNPVPVDLARQQGSDIVIAVNLDYFGGFSEISPDNIGLGEVTDGTIQIMRHHLAQYSLAGADFVIQPPLRSQASWRDYFVKDNSTEIIKLAEKETDKILPKIMEVVFGLSS